MGPARMKKMRELGWVRMIAISLTCLFALDDEFIDTGHINEISRLPESESAEVVFDDSGALSEPAYVPSPQVKEKHVKADTSNRNWQIKKEAARKAEVESKTKHEKKAKAVAKKKHIQAMSTEKEEKAAEKKAKVRENAAKEKKAKERRPKETKQRRRRSRHKTERRK